MLRLNMTELRAKNADELACLIADLCLQTITTDNKETIRRDIQRVRQVLKERHLEVTH